MSGKLVLVGTPIGNLKDITLRALEVLKEADVIACEDTRHSRVLLAAYGISKPLISCYKHKEKESAAKIAALIGEGKTVALITDAGMPSVSDPGAIVVKAVRETGAEVTVAPGPTAFATAVALSGIECSGFTFLGFMPEKSKDKLRFLEKFIDSPLPLVFYCSPHNINADAAFLLSVLGDRDVFAVKEITKIFESVTPLRLNGFQIDEPKGEYVLIVMPGTLKNGLCDLSVAEHVRHYMAAGLAKKDAVKKVAAERGRPKNEIYMEVLGL
ncbi:MAG TPA: 16S rRNA (cytidine(1402)-2'-O)-methyltransferase [Candidatus Faecicola pullistercoris]|nr:16S rRNA (cytidine(1402)-2'-O)-methyltransferase [Candidatus Faecicola pullistercoris]